MQLSYRIPHLEPINVYTWPSGYNRQLASSLVRRYYSYVYMYELGFGRFWHLSNKVYNRWRRVLRSVAKTAVCVCVFVHGSRTVVLHYGSTKCTHAHWWCIHPNVQIKLHTLLLHRPFSWIFRTLLLAFNLAASAHWVEWFPASCL